MQVESPPQFLTELNLPLGDPLVRIVRDSFLDGLLDLDRYNVTCNPEQRMWLRFRLRGIDLPSQGWKLHVSADELSAETVLRRVLPLLLREMITFKCTESLHKLELLNKGDAGESQIGKFITIYPRSDQEAVELARKLDQLTEALSGPCIPSDQMLHSGSLVFYRYGGFDQTAHVQETTGRVWPAIRSADQQLIPDTRALKYHAPGHVHDPFLASGVATTLPKTPRVLAQRYLIMSVISAAINHTISLAVDVQEQRTCIIKGLGHPWQQALPAHVRADFYREATALRELAPNPRIPRLFDLLEQGSELALVIGDIPGITMMEQMSKNRAWGIHSTPQVIRWARDLAGILESIHAKGFVYADLKPTNIIIGSDEKLYLIDFELADRQGAPGFITRGTRGYVSPQQYAGQPRCITDDVYSFGALLYFLMTGAESSNAPDERNLLARPLEVFCPDIPAALHELIVRCLQGEPTRRYPSMRAVLTALDAIGEDAEPFVPLTKVGTLTDKDVCTLQARMIAVDLMHTLSVTARPSADGQGLIWKTAHPVANNFALRDINIGQAGTILAFAGLISQLDEPGMRERLALSTISLLRMPPHSDPPLPGLYIGEAGVGAALLCAGQVLADSALIDAAVERGRCIASLPYTSPDIMHGTAGRLIFHLLLWDETHEQEHLTAAMACGEHLLLTAQERSSGEFCWTIPAGYDGFSQQAYPGYAHGVAGIADALLDLFEATGEQRFVPLIQGATRWLQRQAIPVLADKSGLSWPANEDQDNPFFAFWCHGSTGIGRFFLHASRYDWLPGTHETALRAANAVLQLTKYGGPTLCHGLAGSIDFLLDVYQETHDPFYLAEARTFGKLLEAFSTEQAGQRVFYSDQLGIISPDYQVGYAGIAIAFLRLSAPDRLPSQLSRVGFREYK